MSTPLFTVKRGDTLSLAGFLPAGSIPAGNWVARCSVLHRSTNILHAITARLVAPHSGEPRWMLSLTAEASQTALWPPGRYVGDVEFSDPSALPEPLKMSSNDFTFLVEPDRVP